MGLPPPILTNEYGEPLTWRVVAERMIESDPRTSVETYVRWRVVEDRRKELGIAPTLDELLPRIPSDRLMIETDAPFLTPPAAKAKRNEPAFLGHVLSAVASALDRPEEFVERETDTTACAFFGLEGGFDVPPA